MAKIDGEFDGKTVPNTASAVAHASQRKLQIFRNLVFAPEALSSIGTSVFTVATIAGVEALLMSRRGAAGRTKFVFRYSVSQVLPSIIWASKPAALVCKRARLEPNAVLELALGSKKESQIYQLQTIRSIIAGFVGIAQILRIVDLAGEADREYRKGISLGREPLVSGVSERFVRLAGKTSDVTALSMMTCKQHIVPVFENPSVVSTLIHQHSQGGVQPCFWHIPSRSYSNMALWEGFNLMPEWLIPVRSSKTTKKVLVVEADASVGEEALALGSPNTQNDLEPSEAGQAFVSLQKKLSEMAKQTRTTEQWDIVRVFLGDSRVPVRSGGGAEISQRELLEAYDEVDIFIDAKIPLLKAVQCWLTQAGGETEGQGGGQEHGQGGRRREVVFDTRNQEYFAAMRTVLESQGWVVKDKPAVVDQSHDGAKPSKGAVQADSRRSQSQQQWSKSRACFAASDDLFIVYEKSTADTVHQVRQIIKAGLPPSRVCALLDRVEGVAELHQLSQDLGGVDLRYVCSAMVYDELFAAVRARLREGRSTQEIQQWLDQTLAR